MITSVSVANSRSIICCTFSGHPVFPSYVVSTLTSSLNKQLKCERKGIELIAGTAYLRQKKMCDIVVSILQGSDGGL
jgi:hypothetical protein